MKKEIIFFDGDGTVWYPRETKRREKPHWIYAEKKSLDRYCEQLILTPTTFSTLEKLKKCGIVTVLLSTHPHVTSEARSILRYKVVYFHLENFFDEIHATLNEPDSKGKFMLNVLQRKNISKNRALMVGDSYLWDYKPAKNNGIEALLMESEYRRKDPGGRRIRRVIKVLNDVFRYL